MGEVSSIQRGADWLDAAAEKALAKIQHQPPPKPKPEEPGWDLAELMQADVPEPKLICPPFIAEGLTIYAGKPKIGKTTLMRQLLLAANTGGLFLNQQSERVEDLFLSLEEGALLARKKFNLMASAEEARGIRCVFSWNRGQAGADQLTAYLRRHPATRLVVIDSLSRFRAPANTKAPQFQQDYEAISALQGVCKVFPGLAIVVIHHTNKANFDDPLDCISGTYGLTAACDSYGVILRKEDRFRLHWGGRLWDQDVCDFELVRDGGKWWMAGPFDMDAVRLPRAQSQVLEILKREGTVTGTGIASRLGITKQSAYEVLKKLQSQALARQTKDGYQAI